MSSDLANATTPDLYNGEWPKFNFQIRPGSWRDEVKARATRLRADALLLREATLPKAEEELVNVEIREPLQRVQHLLDDPISFWKRPWEWLSGSRIEECWRLLRQAEEGLLQVVQDESVLERVRAAEVHGEKWLGHDHPLMKALQELRAPNGDTKELRSAALDVLRASHDNSDRQHRQMRSFRNQLLGVSGALVALAGVLLVAQYWVADRLIPTPDNVEMGPALALAFIMFFGCIGALFSAVPSLAQIPETSSPYFLARQQAILKVITGAWSAVIGLLVVNAGLGSAQPEVASLGGLAILAALFGAGQEAVTRFADNKAGDILRSS